MKWGISGALKRMQIAATKTDIKMLVRHKNKEQFQLFMIKKHFWWIIMFIIFKLMIWFYVVSLRST